jgi:hypothetical protein
LAHRHADAKDGENRLGELWGSILSLHPAMRWYSKGPKNPPKQADEAI